MISSTELLDSPKAYHEVWANPLYFGEERVQLWNHCAYQNHHCNQRSKVRAHWSGSSMCFHTKPRHGSVVRQGDHHSQPERLIKETTLDCNRCFENSHTASTESGNMPNAWSFLGNFLSGDTTGLAGLARILWCCRTEIRTLTQMLCR